MKHLFQFSLFLLALLLPATALAYDFEVNGIYYNKYDRYRAIVTYGPNVYSGDVTIPATVTYDGTNFSVTYINRSAFSYCSGLTSVSIPNTIKAIGDEAFYNCSCLTSVDIPNSVTSIGKNAFFYCSGLTSLTIGNSVTSIGDGAFSCCSGLTSIQVASGNSTYDSRNNCNAIIETASNTLITGCMKTIIPNSVTTIGRSAFYNCSGLTSVTIPNSVTSIGNSAFGGCSGLTCLTIGNSVTSIGNSAFGGCNSITDLIWNARNCLTDGIPTSNIERITIGNEVEILHDWFVSRSKITSVDIPNSVTTIGSYAFYLCDSLTSVTIGNSETTIGNSVTTIGKDAFSYCSGLTSLTIGNSVTSIGEYAFYDCHGLTSLTIGNSVTTIGRSAFMYCSGLTSVTIPNSVTSIGDMAFCSCTGLTSVTIGSSVTAIGVDAFGPYYDFNNYLLTVICRGTVPPVMASDNCFTMYSYKYTTLLVPRQSVEAYQATDCWYMFDHIQGYDEIGVGDVDGDGLVTISDVTAQIDALLLGDVDNISFESADLNGNGRLDIDDVTTLIDLLLNGD